MRRAAAVLLLILLASAAPPTGQAHRIGNPEWVSFLLDHAQTPDLAPGEGGTFSVVVNNTFPWPIKNISLTFEVYRYREVDVDLPVNTSAWTGPGPYFLQQSGDLDYAIEPPVPPLDPGNSSVVSFPVVTYPDTPHGSLTKQGSYFVRARIVFDFADANGTTTNTSVMMSRGWFTDAQFDVAREPCDPATSYCAGLLNMTYLGSVYGLTHLDGLLSDFAFSVKDRMPAWPYYVVGGAMVASLVFAVLFYAEENPGRYPRIARWWLAVKGKAQRARPRKPR